MQRKRRLTSKGLPQRILTPVSDERLAEIRAMLDADHPAQGVDEYQLAGAIYDLLAERDEFI